MMTEILREIDEKGNVKIVTIKAYWKTKLIWTFHVETKEIGFNENLNGIEMIMVVEHLMLKLLQIVLFEVQQVDLQVTRIVIANLQVEHGHQLREKTGTYGRVMMFHASGNSDHHIKISRGIVIECLDNVKICLIEIVIQESEICQKKRNSLQENLKYK